MDQDFLQVRLKAYFKEFFKSGAEGSLNDNITRSLAIGAFVGWNIQRKHLKRIKRH